MNPNSSDCNTEFSLSSTKKSDSTKKADLKERVSNTLNMRRHKKKQLATVKPIKLSDEKALDSAIAMTNALASKSMHDIDKKSMEQFYEHSPGRSPITPTSPSKKFSFFFPTVNSGKFRSEEQAGSLYIDSNFVEKERDCRVQGIIVNYSCMYSLKAEERINEDKLQKA